MAPMRAVALFAVVDARFPPILNTVIYSAVQHFAPFSPHVLYVCARVSLNTDGHSAKEGEIEKLRRSRGMTSARGMKIRMRNEDDGDDDDEDWGGW